ncbi:hypothetical protein MRX96_023043 [Rhipicephalus microplus]
MRHLPVLIVQGALLCGAVCWTAAQREHGHDLLPPPFRVSSPATLILDDIVASTWQQSFPSTIHVTAGPGYKSYRTTGGFGHYTASDMRHLPVLIVQGALLCGAVCWTAAQRVPPALKHLFDRQLGLLRDFTYRVKWQRDCVDCPWLFEVFPPYSISSIPAVQCSSEPAIVQCDSAPPEVHPKIPMTQDHSSSLHEESPGYFSSSAVNARNFNMGPEMREMGL